MGYLSENLKSFENEIGKTVMPVGLRTTLNDWHYSVLSRQKIFTFTTNKNAYVDIKTNIFVLLKTVLSGTTTNYFSNQVQSIDVMHSCRGCTVSFVLGAVVGFGQQRNVSCTLYGF